jgi:hypothetical protein
VSAGAGEFGGGQLVAPGPVDAGGDQLLADVVWQPPGPARLGAPAGREFVHVHDAGLGVGAPPFQHAQDPAIGGDRADAPSGSLVAVGGSLGLLARPAVRRSTHSPIFTPGTDIDQVFVRPAAGWRPGMPPDEALGSVARPEVTTAWT